MIKENNTCQQNILCLAKFSFKRKREIKTLPDKQKLREFIITSPILQYILNGVFQEDISVSGALDSNLKLYQGTRTQEM